MSLPATLIAALLFVLLSPTLHAQGHNQAFGINLWADGLLWDDKIDAVVARFPFLASEGATTSNYFGIFPTNATVLGARAYTLQIYGKDNTVSSVVIGFLNKADLEREIGNEMLAKSQPKQTTPTPTPADGTNNIVQLDPLLSQQVLIELEKQWAAKVPIEKETLVQKLRTSLGAPKTADEKKSTWIYGEDQIELSLNTSSLSLQISPRSASRTASSQASKNLSRNVKRTPSGDVILQNIPDIAQGPRGFCLPASWEKVLRYLDIHTNIYDLVEMGGTTGSGTSMGQMTATMATELDKQGHKVIPLSTNTPTPDEIKDHIDKGLPLIWAMYANELDNWIAENPKRTAAGLPTKSPMKPGQTEPVPAPNSGHALTVIGYNERSNEIAVSDTRRSDASFQEIWIRAEDAAKFSAGAPLVVVQPASAATAAAGTEGASGTAQPLSTEMMRKRRF